MMRYFVAVTICFLAFHSFCYASPTRDDIIEAVKNDEDVRAETLKRRSMLGLGKIETNIENIEIYKGCGPAGCMTRTLVIMTYTGRGERVSVIAVVRTNLSGEKIDEVTLVQAKPKYPIRKENKSASFQTYSSLKFWDHLFVDEF